MTAPTRRDRFFWLCLASVLVWAGCEEPNPEDTVGQVTDKFMSIHVMDEKHFPFVEHKTTGFNERCEIAADGLNEDIVCYLDVQEADINVQLVKLQYNVPPGMCDYATFGAYWYWNFEPGFGPQEVQRTLVYETNGTITVSTCTADGLPCGAGSEAQSNGDCMYDYSTVDENLPNCCFGRYGRFTTTITPTGSSTNFESGEWGGSIIDCISGPAATDDSWPKMADGLPIMKTHYTSEDGVNAKLEVKPPIEVSGYPGNFHTANHYTVGRHDHQGFFASGRTSQLPYALDPITDRSGSTFGVPGQPRAGYPAQDAYELRCYDRAYEIKNRIRFYIRDWNTRAEFEAFRESEGAQGNPDVEGTDGQQCEYGLPLSQCNDDWDWDDIKDSVEAVAGPGSSYDDLSPALRSTLFPFEPKVVSAPTQ